MNFKRTNYFDKIIIIFMLMDQNSCIVLQTYLNRPNDFMNVLISQEP